MKFIILVSCVWAASAVEIKHEVAHTSRAGKNAKAKTFTCHDGQMTIEKKFFNDDYCDCEDGSDEPGSHACSHVRHFCANEGAQAKYVYSRKLNDGRCDCCDGSDEPQGSCESTCSTSMLQAESSERYVPIDPKLGELPKMWKRQRNQDANRLENELEGAMVEFPPETAPAFAQADRSVVALAAHSTKIAPSLTGKAPTLEKDKAEQKSEMESKIANILKPNKRFKHSSAAVDKKKKTHGGHRNVQLSHRADEHAKIMPHHRKISLPSIGNSKTRLSSSPVSMLANQHPPGIRRSMEGTEIKEKTGVSQQQGEQAEAVKGDQQRQGMDGGGMGGMAELMAMMGGEPQLPDRRELLTNRDETNQLSDSTFDLSTSYPNAPRPGQLHYTGVARNPPVGVMAATPIDTTNSSGGYYRFPSVHGETLVFVCEDDLWLTSVTGGIPRRLTNGLTMATRPFISPDGQKIAYMTMEEGISAVYLMDINGGNPKRLTYFNSDCIPIGWHPSGQFVLFMSDAQSSSPGSMDMFFVAAEGGLPIPMKLGDATHVAFGAEDGQILVGRHTMDIFRWKRYRGGKRGKVFIDATGQGNFSKLLKMDGNIASPMWIGERVYFVSDDDGVGKLMSAKVEVNKKGEIKVNNDLQVHTNNKKYYVRNPSTDGKTIVFHAGGDIYAMDVKSGLMFQVKMQWKSPQMQRRRKVVSGADYLQSVSVHPTKSEVVAISRGRMFQMHFFDGPVIPKGNPHGVQYKNVVHMQDGETMVVVSDEPGSPVLEVYANDGDQKLGVITNDDIGVPQEMKASPTANELAIINHKKQLILVNVNNATVRKVDESHDGVGLMQLAWAPDGNWLAYTVGTSEMTSIIRVLEVESGETWDVTRAVFNDHSPSWDPEGRFLYLLSSRDFMPEFDEMMFQIGFGESTRPYLIPLNNQTFNPFLKRMDAKQDVAELMQEMIQSQSEYVEIDFEGIQDRLIAFPVAISNYVKIIGIVKNGVHYLKADGTVAMYDFDLQMEATLAMMIVGFTYDPISENIIIFTEDFGEIGTHILAKNVDVGKLQKMLGEMWFQPGPISGKIDMNRIRLTILPPYEWKHIYADAWRQMKEHYWTATMSGVDWGEMYNRYVHLVERCASRTELSDIISELQGEMGTSHCYEKAGSGRPVPPNMMAQLGADFMYNEQVNSYIISHLVVGDSWDPMEGGALVKPGMNLNEGDVLLAINDQPLSKEVTPHHLLFNAAGQEMWLTVLRITSKEKQPVRFVVRGMMGEQSARYRDWVEANAAFVHNMTDGRVGYVHIPDMGEEGYAEFHRYFLTECRRPALLVDVRHNGGGMVSQLILDKLMRVRLGYDVQRWGSPTPYPNYSVLGPKLLLADEGAGSDGDIFTHAWRMLQLGPIVGHQTWGGVVGMNQKRKLMDGSSTTQPEFFSWFNDVGWGVENHGVDPDVEVDLLPHDYLASNDPQLETGAEMLLKLLDESGVSEPDFSLKDTIVPGVAQDVPHNGGFFKSWQEKMRGKDQAASNMQQGPEGIPAGPGPEGAAAVQQPQQGDPSGADKIAERQAAGGIEGPGGREADGDQPAPAAPEAPSGSAGMAAQTLAPDPAPDPEADPTQEGSDGAMRGQSPSAKAAKLEKEGTVESTDAKDDDDSDQ